MTDEEARVEAMRLLDAGDKIIQQSTLCKDCDRVCSDTRKFSPFKWRCLAHPIKLQTPIGLEFVDPDWRPDPPYLSCHVANKEGSCEHFTPRRMPTKETAE